MSTTSGSSPQGLELSGWPGTTLALTQQVPLDARSVGVLKPGREALQQYPALVFAVGNPGKVAGAGDGEVADLTRS